mgnify:CR=1 FL=1
MPFENGKGGAGGNPGVLLAIPKSNVEGDDGKLMRICHILDAMVYGGEAYFQTVQGGGLDVYPDYDGDVREYKEDGRSFCYYLRIIRDSTEPMVPITWHWLHGRTSVTP